MNGKDVAGDVLLDPNIVTALFAIPSGGATVAGRAAIGEAARQNARLTKAKLQDAITKETAKSYGLMVLLKEWLGVAYIIISCKTWI